MHDGAADTQLANVAVNSGTLTFTFNYKNSSEFDEMTIPISPGCSIHKKLR